MYFDRSAAQLFLTGLAVACLFLSPIFAPYVLAPRPLNFYLVPTWISFALLIGFAGLPNISLPSSRLLIVLLALTFPVVIYSSIQGYGPEILSWILLICLLIIFAFNLTDDSVRYLYLLFVIASLVWSTLALVVWFGWTNGTAVHIGNWALTTDLHGLSGPFVNRNVMGGLISCSWIMLVWFWLQNSRSPWLSLAFIALAAVAMTSMSRSVFLLMGIASLSVVTALLIDRKYRQLIWFIAYLLVALLLAQGLADLGQGGTFTDRFEQTRSEGLGARKTIWLSSLALWLDQPIFGVGLGQLGSHYLDGQFEAQSIWSNLPESRGLVRDAHNILLQLMVEAGVPGLAFALLITLLLTIQFIKHATDTTSLYWPALMAACMLWIQGMFNLTMTTPHAIFYFSLFFGIAIVQKSTKSSHFQLPKSLLLAVLVCIIAFMGTLTSKYTVSWLTFEQWIKSDSETVKKADAEYLLQDAQLMPYFVDFVTQQVMRNPYRYYQLPGMLPYIDRALTRLQMPFLYQGKFLALTVAGDFDQACKIGRFIQGQHWPKELNQAAYARACNKLPPENYIAGWQ